MREKLDKKKVELAERQAKFYDESFGAGVHVGWNHCQSELLPLIEEMREALEFYASQKHAGKNQCEYETDEGELVRIHLSGHVETGWRAHQALEKLKKWEES
jgi:hypothetical protein